MTALTRSVGSWFRGLSTFGQVAVIVVLVIAAPMLWGILKFLVGLAVFTAFVVLGLVILGVIAIPFLLAWLSRHD